MENCNLPRPNDGAICEESARGHAIAAYAAEMAGSEFDLDRALEGATLDLLFESESQ